MTNSETCFADVNMFHCKILKTCNKLLKIQAEDFIPNVWSIFFLKILFLDKHIQHAKHSPDMEIHLP